MHCIHVIYQELLHSVSMSRKEDLEEIAFEIEFEKEIRKQDNDDDGKRLEKWHIGRRNFS